MILRVRVPLVRRGPRIARLGVDEACGLKCTNQGVNTVDEFIQLISAQLGLDPEKAKAATGGILNLIREQLDDQTFAQISSRLPGIQGLSGAGGAAGSAGGMLDSLTSLAGSLLGGKAKTIAEISAILTKHGLSVEKIPQYLALLINFLKSRLGDDLFAKVAAKLPELLGA
ncbi:MAG: DUF2780 domain-containing protein [Planctomycetota bacterium]